MGWVLSPGIDVVSWETSPLFAGADLRFADRSLVAADALWPLPWYIGRHSFERIQQNSRRHSSQDLQLGGDCGVATSTPDLR